MYTLYLILAGALLGPYLFFATLWALALAREIAAGVKQTRPAEPPLTDAEREELLAYGKELALTLGPRYGPVA